MEWLPNYEHLNFIHESPKKAIIKAYKMKSNSALVEAKQVIQKRNKNRLTIIRINSKEVIDDLIESAVRKVLKLSSFIVIRRL